MVNPTKYIYFIIISLTLSLLYMGIHLHLLSSTLDIAQGSEGGFNYAHVGFWGYDILSKHGNQYTSLTTPSVVLTIILLINLVFLVRFWKNSLIDKRIIFFNTALITLSLFLYHLFLGNLNHYLELAVINEDFYFRDVGPFGFEFTNKIGSNFVPVKTGFNFSPVPLIVALLADFVYFRRLKKK